MKTIEVKFHLADTGFCRAYYKDVDGNMYCVQQESDSEWVWYTVAPGHHMEPDCPVRDAEFVIVKSFKGDEEGEGE